MISAWHVLWIVPLSVMFGIIIAALLAASDSMRELSNFSLDGDDLEDADGYYIDDNFNAVKREDSVHKEETNEDLNEPR